MNGEFTYQEIKSQPQAWQASLAHANEQYIHVQEHIQKPWPEVIFTGCGSTHYLSLSAAARWQALTGISARGIPASEIWHYPQSILTKATPLLVAVSRSGSTTETIKAIQQYQTRYDQQPVVISCYPDNPMVNSSPYVLLTKDAEEKSVAQTKSFTSMLVMAQYLALQASPNAIKLADQIQTLPKTLDGLFSQYESAIQEVAIDRQFSKFVFLGSGINYGLASEAMLKMKEMSLSISEVFHFMEFRHGPMSMVTEDTLVIGLVDDATDDEELKVLKEMQKIGARTLAIGESLQKGQADHIFSLKSGVDPLVRGPLYIPLLQLLAYYRAMHNGLDPDTPRNLTVFVDLSD